jgi:hypothetical protein
LVQPSQPFAGKTKSFATHLLPETGAARAHGGAGESPAAEGASGGGKRAPIASVAPTLADLRVLWGGRDRLLRVAEVAEHLGVCNATVYGLCERGEPPQLAVVRDDARPAAPFATRLLPNPQKGRAPGTRRGAVGKALRGL